MYDYPRPKLNGVRQITLKVETRKQSVSPKSPCAENRPDILVWTFGPYCMAAYDSAARPQRRFHIKRVAFLIAIVEEAVRGRWLVAFLCSRTLFPYTRLLRSLPPGGR